MGGLNPSSGCSTCDELRVRICLPEELASAPVVSTSQAVPSRGVAVQYHVVLTRTNQSTPISGTGGSYTRLYPIGMCTKREHEKESELVGVCFVEVAEVGTTTLFKLEGA